MLSEELQRSVPFTPDVQQSAREMVESALACCVRRGVCNCTESLQDLLKQGNGNAHGYFRHALAEQVAVYLGGMDETVQAAYCYQCSAQADELEPDEPDVTSEASILLHVERKTAALSSMLKALEQAAVSHYRSLLAPYASNMRYLLDIQVIDDDDVLAGRGLAGLLNSVYAKPVKVWER